MAAAAAVQVLVQQAGGEHSSAAGQGCGAPGRGPPPCPAPRSPLPLPLLTRSSRRRTRQSPAELRECTGPAARAGRREGTRGGGVGCWATPAPSCPPPARLFSIQPSALAQCHPAGKRRLAPSHRRSGPCQPAGGWHQLHRGERGGGGGGGGEGRRRADGSCEETGSEGGHGEPLVRALFDPAASPPDVPRPHSLVTPSSSTSTTTACTDSRER